MGLSRKALFSALRILLLLAVVLGGGWFVLSLGYDDEQARVQANEGIEAARPLMEVVQERYTDTGRLPAAAELPILPPANLRHVANMELDADLSMTVTYRGVKAIDGKTLRLIPSVGADKRLRWRCELSTIDPRWWPDYCRQKPTP